MAPRMAVVARLRVGLSMHMTLTLRYWWHVMHCVMHCAVYCAVHCAMHRVVHYPRRMLRGCSMPRGGRGGAS